MPAATPLAQLEARFVQFERALERIEKRLLGHGASHAPTGGQASMSGGSSISGSGYGAGPVHDEMAFYRINFMR